MNIQECDILNSIISFPYTNQRRLSETSGHSLGVVNRSIKNLLQEGYINEEIQPTKKALDMIHASAPKTQLFWQRVLECVWFQSIQKFLKDS